VEREVSQQPTVHPDGRARAKQVFKRGLAALLPTLLTLVILFVAFDFLRKNVGYWISRGLTYFWEWVWGYRIPVGSLTASLLSVVGLLLAVLVVFLLGYFVTTVVGRWMYGVVDDWLSRLPVVRQVYPSVKQVTNFFLSERALHFTQVVAVPYPRTGVYTLGFVTGRGFAEVDRAAGRKMVCVLVPSSPTPFSGYAVFFPEEEVVYLKVSVEEGLRFVMSSGVVFPGTVPTFSGLEGRRPLPGGGEPGADASPPSPTTSA